MLSISKYVRAGSVEEAYELVRKNRRACVLGGGAWLRLGSGTIPVAIDLAACGLNGIDEVADDPAFGRALRIGAYVTLRQVETSTALAAATGGLIARAVRDIVGVQFRNVATVGGSVAGRFGFSDVCCALLALGAHVELAGAGRMPLAAFLAQPGRMRDVLAYVVVPAGPVAASYQAVRNQSTDFPVVNACAVRTAAGAWRVAVGARPGRARLVEGPADELSPAGSLDKKNPATGAAPSPDRLAPGASAPAVALSACPAAAELDAVAAAAQALPFSGNMWASERYRRHVAGVLVRRAVEEAAARAAQAAGLGAESSAVSAPDGAVRTTGPAAEKSAASPVRATGPAAGEPAASPERGATSEGAACGAPAPGAAATGEEAGR